MDFDEAAMAELDKAQKQVDALNKEPKAQNYTASTTMPLHLQSKNAALIHQVLAKTLADYIVRDFAPRESGSDTFEIKVVVMTPEDYRRLKGEA